MAIPPCEGQRIGEAAKRSAVHERPLDQTLLGRRRLAGAYVVRAATVHALRRNGRAGAAAVLALVPILVTFADRLQRERAARDTVPNERLLAEAASRPSDSGGLAVDGSAAARAPTPRPSTGAHTAPGRALHFRRGRPHTDKDADVIVDRKRQQRLDVPVAPCSVRLDRRQQDTEGLRRPGQLPTTLAHVRLSTVARATTRHGLGKRRRPSHGKSWP